jgi:arylsulfatase A-like enzyme
MGIKSSSVINRRSLLGGAASLAAASAIAARPNPVAARRGFSAPHIVFIMADDLGYADVGCFGARTIRTPHIDRIAREGLKLVNGYANSPVCSATRTALMTGRYQYRLRCGLEEPIGLGNIGLPPNEPTLPRHLQKLGYRTALVGKWHLGNMPDYGPLRSGYDRFFGIQEGGADYFSHIARTGPMETAGLVEGETLVKSAGYLTDLLGQRAVREVEEAVSDNVPLFLSLHFTAPHWPWEGPEDEAAAKAVGNSFHFDGGNLETYGKMVESMDASVGKLLAALDALGITDNTILVFTSDNGGERYSDVWPFTGAKTELLEGGIRVPIIMRWPRRIQAGKTSEQIAISMDFVPTLLAAAGGKLESDMHFDGVNLLPVLTGESPTLPRELFWRYNYGDQAAALAGAWKYLKLGGREYLFDLTEDQHERANKKDLLPDRIKQLKQRFAEWNATMLPYPEGAYSHSISDFLPDRYRAAPTPPAKPKP